MIRPGCRRRRRRLTSRVAAVAGTGPRIGLVALAAMLAGGCTGTDTPIDRVPINEQVRMVVAEVSVLNARMDKAVAACMRSQGFPFFARTARDHFDELTDTLSIRFGLSIEDAQSNGYGPGPRSGTTDEERRYFQRLSQRRQDAYTLAHLGTEEDLVPYSSPSGAQSSYPVGGCIRPAAEEVYGSVQAHVESMGLFDDLQYMTAAILVRAEGDEALQQALTEWSACMGGEGYSFESPAAARDSALESREAKHGGGYGSPTLKERAIALADARCQDKSSISGTFLRAAVDAQSSFIAENDQLFAAWDELMEQVAARGYPPVGREGRDLISRAGG
jgi:hypothetical protein